MMEEKKLAAGAAIVCVNCEHSITDISSAIESEGYAVCGTCTTDLLKKVEKQGGILKYRPLSEWVAEQEIIKAAAEREAAKAAEAARQRVEIRETAEMLVLNREKALTAEQVLAVGIKAPRIHGGVVARAELEKCLVKRALFDKAQAAFEACSGKRSPDGTDLRRSGFGAYAEALNNLIGIPIAKVTRLQPPPRPFYPIFTVECWDRKRRIPVYFLAPMDVAQEVVNLLFAEECDYRKKTEKSPISLDAFKARRLTRLDYLVESLEAAKAKGTLPKPVEGPKQPFSIGKAAPSKLEDRPATERISNKERAKLLKKEKREWQAENRKKALKDIFRTA